MTKSRVPTNGGDRINLKTTNMMIAASMSNLFDWTSSLETKELIGTSAVTFALIFFLMFLRARQSSPTHKSADGQVFQSPSEIPSDVLNSLDAILVLGGGVPTSVDEPPVYVQQRCDDAAAVVKLPRDSSPLPILTLSAGTAHLPQLMSQDGLPVWESTASAAYLEKRHGMTNVYVETTSYDTIGNAYFARTSHTDVNGWRKLLIITNEFHMDRTKAIFDWIFGIDDDGYKLYYLSSENVGLTATGLEARRLHEQKGAMSVTERLAPQYMSLKDVWGFLTQKHDLYTASKLVDRARQSDVVNARSGSLKESYGAK